MALFVSNYACTFKRLNLQEGRHWVWSSVQYWFRTCDVSTV